MTRPPTDGPPTPPWPEHSAQVFYERGLACREAGDIAGAEAFLLKAVGLAPEGVAYHFSLGSLYHDQGRLDEAASRYMRAAELDEFCAGAHYNLGLLFLQTRRFEAAAQAFQRAIEADPASAAAHNNLGIALQELGLSPEAFASFQLAGRMDPAYAPAHANAGRVLLRQERWDEAIYFLKRATACRPDSADAWHDLGLCFHKKRDLDQARSCYEKALAADPGHHASHLDLGNVCLDRGDLSGMAEWYRKALELAPADAAALANVGRMFQDQGRLAEAMECFDAALAKNPEDADAHFSRAGVLLAQGRWPEGWAEYEWRFRRADWKNAYPHRLRAPRWDGSRFERKTLLVHCEQGFGDAIQFVRYLPAVKDRGGTVLVEAPAPLIPLFRRAGGIDALLETSESRTPAAQYDLQVPLLSLPGIFSTTPETVPAEIPYLSADPGKASEWAQRIAGGQVKVGIVWGASNWNRALAGKSCRLVDFMALLSVPGVRLYGLQKGPAAQEARAVPAETGFLNLGEEFEDFADTAAAIAPLELVVSVDTAVAHLAGAMGKPVFLLLPFSTDWRWMESRDDSPWYPTMRLFRQKVNGDWSGVFGRVRRELTRWPRRPARIEPGGL